MRAAKASALEDAASLLMDAAKHEAHRAGVDSALLAAWKPGGSSNPTTGLFAIRAAASVFDVARRRRRSPLTDANHFRNATMDAELTVCEALAVGGDVAWLRTAWAPGGESNPSRDGFAANALAAVASTVLEIATAHGASASSSARQAIPFGVRVTAAARARFRGSVDRARRCDRQQPQYATVQKEP